MLMCTMLAPGGAAAKEPREPPSRVTPAPVQPQAAADADGARARDLFEQAVERLESGRFAEAKELLEESLALTPHPATAFNLAVASRGTGDVLGATQWLAALEAGHYGPLSAEQREQVSALAKSLKAQVAELTVRVRGAPHAEIRIDGQKVGSAERQLVVPVNPGKRLVRVSATDRVPGERVVRIQPGEKLELFFSLALTPEAQVGRLVIDAERPDHRIEIEGVAAGRGHLDMTVEPGSYTVHVSSPEGSRKTTLTVNPRSTVRYQFDAIQSSVLQSPLFWIGVAGVVAAGTVATILLVRPDAPEPVSDPTYGTIHVGLGFP